MDQQLKFTRGEKCIFIHLILSFILIFILVIVYTIHLYLVGHTRNGIFSTRRSVLGLQRTSEPDIFLVGYIYLNLTVPKFICNTLILNSHWSACPAHCVSMRTNPDLAHLSFVWLLKYRISSNDASGLEAALRITQIKKTIIHPFFNRGTFANNIALVEHSKPIPPESRNFITTVPLPAKNQNMMFVVGWNHDHTAFENFDSGSFIKVANKINDAKCSEILAPVSELRIYEFCVTFKEKDTKFLDFGLVVFANSNPLGFFSWGERLQKVLPSVMINITIFRDWLKTTTAL